MGRWEDLEKVGKGKCDRNTMYENTFFNIKANRTQWAIISNENYKNKDMKSRGGRDGSGRS